MQRMIQFVKKETVFVAALVLALLSAVAVHPDSAYLNYPDYRTLALLFCLMIIVAGFQWEGVFAMMGQALLRKAGNKRVLSMILVLLCFFCSMIITNDVTLLTFVPFTMMVMGMVGQTGELVKLVVLETIAANLGSMATPIGNPQNLYLYSVSGLTPMEFSSAVLPYAGTSLLLLVAAVIVGKNEPLAGQVSAAAGQMTEKRFSAGIIPYLLLLILCLLVVFRVLPYFPVLLVVMAVIFAVNRRLYLKVDYFLLLTFLFFFVFVGNVKRIPEISNFIATLVEGRELTAGILVSQVISNVPAAILLSGFTGNYASLLTGVNLGGLGTLVASLASLISYKIYTREFPEQKGKFLVVFTFWNVLFLLILYLFAN